MKLRILLLLIILFLNNSVFGQDRDELQTINSKSKVQFIKPEALDQLMISLRKFETSPDRKLDTLMLETYKNIASVYMANNHFKQAYEVYLKYLLRKEDMLSADKADFLSQKINSVSLKNQKDEKDETELQTKLTNLKVESKNLDSKQLSFKSNFSLALIILSSVFALILLSTGIRMMNLRSKLQSNRERMKEIHRKAVTGNFAGGLRSSMKSVLKSSQDQVKEFHHQLNNQEQSFSPVKQANQVISGIEKSFVEIWDIL